MSWFFFFDSDTEETEEYRAFVEKFKPKKTTDDCYTPEGVYNAVVDWVKKEYGLNRARFVRPFWPGGDYQSANYPPGAVVVDNPPFSILTGIMQYYQAQNVPFFLFSPTLTLLSRVGGVCHIAVGVQITYENGAVVNTSFVTNMEPGIILRTAPDLYKAVEAANDEEQRKKHKSMPKYIYPDNVVTAAMAYRWSKYGVYYRLNEKECVRISALDDQKAKGVKSGIDA